MDSPSPSPSPFPAAIFDLDGTLVDSLRDLAEATNWGLDQLGLPKHAVDSYKYMVGMGRRVLCERAVPADRQELVDQVSSLMTEHYGEHCFDYSRPYAGILPMLTRLQEREVKLAVLSNKPQNFVDLTVGRLLPGIAFEALVGENDQVGRKPDPRGALMIAERMGLPAEVIAYVGDTSIDMETAKRAGMFALGVTWGFRDRAELEGAGARQIVDTPEQLYQALVDNEPSK